MIEWSTQLSIRNLFDTVLKRRGVHYEIVYSTGDDQNVRIGTQMIIPLIKFCEKHFIRAKSDMDTFPLADTSVPLHDHVWLRGIWSLSLIS